MVRLFVLLALAPVFVGCGLITPSKTSEEDKEMRELLAEAVDPTEQKASGASALDKMLQQVERAAADIGELNDPNHAYVLSNIETD